MAFHHIRHPMINANRGNASAIVHQIDKHPPPAVVYFNVSERIVRPAGECRNPSYRVLMEVYRQHIKRDMEVVCYGAPTCYCTAGTCAGRRKD